MTRYKLLFFVHFLVLPVAAVAQPPEAMRQAGEFERAARAAAKGNDNAGLLTNMLKANELRPNHPRIIYNLSCAYSLNGEEDKAIQTLERLGRMGLTFSVEKDEDLRPVFDHKGFPAVVRQFATNGLPTGKPEKVFEFGGSEAFISEGVAFDPAAKAFFVTSVHQRKIVRIGPDGTRRDFSKDSDGLWGAFGIRVDPKTKKLWVTTMAAPAMRGFQESERGRSGIFRYDLKSGKLEKRYILPYGERHGLGDLTIDRNGVVFATDSASPSIYYIDPRSDELKEFLRSESFTSLQGLAFDESGKWLFVADYSKGIFRIDIRTKKVTQMRQAADVALLGIDGLYVHKGDLIIIQNGISPHRIAALTMSGDAVTASKTLASGHAEMRDPTLGVTVGNKLYFVASSQWPFVGEKGEIDSASLRPAVIYSIELKRP